MFALLQRRMRRLSLFVFLLLVIELLDELVFGAEQAALPLIRDDLGLNYIQIGLYLALPKLIASFIEPFLGILGDTHHRRKLILGGGVAFALSLVVTGISPNFPMLLLGAILFFPASGAFVSLSQGALMDHEPTRHEQNMARWTFAGSVGVVGGSLALGAFASLGWGWRPLMLVLAVLTLIVLLAAWRFPFPVGHASSEDDEAAMPRSFREGARLAFGALRRREVLRWLTLLEFSDLMLDVLLGYLALYFVDVVGWTEGGAALAITVWTGVGLLGDFALIFLLERVRGLDYLRYSVGLQLLLYPAFLLVDNVAVKLVLLALMGFFNAGWYAVLAGQLYSAMPGQSGAVIVVGNIAGWFGSFLPLALGVIAEQFSLTAAMWCLLAGPIALLIGLPRRASATASDEP